MKKIFFVLVALFCGAAVYSQSQTTIELMDIMVHPVFKADSVSGVPLPSDELNIIFKINSAVNAAHVHVLFGTAQDMGDVFTLQADIVAQNNIYYVSYNQIQKQIKGYTAQLIVALTPQQKANYNYITLFVEDNNAEETNRLYFRKNNQ